jgi:glycine/serine hydroxymethyltransferase
VIYLVGGSLHNTRYYASLSGLDPRTCRIVLELEQLRATNRPRVIVLGPSNLYRPGTWNLFQTMLDNRRAVVQYDDTDRILGVNQTQTED